MDQLTANGVQRVACMTSRTSSVLTVLAYHYVRDLERSRYPGIKGRTTSDFEGQLNYIQRHYNVVSVADVLAASRGERGLPDNPCALTFDDGLIDHFAVVLPRLVERGLTGVFFPSARPIREDIVLDVHKLHFVLASCQNHARLLEETRYLLVEYGRDNDVPSYQALCAEYHKPNRYDPGETAFLKRLLQFALPEAVRAPIVNELFQRHVSVDERTFSRELYMDTSQLRCLLSNGMELGGHGDRHDRIGLLPRERQTEELRATHQFLQSIDPKIAHNWIMCFPYGNFSADSLEIAAQLGCAAAVSVNPALVRLPIQREGNRAPVLDRLDTNDLPLSADAAPSAWTTRDAQPNES